ncbi:MAG: hypothetical protein Q9214_007777, partial [Letrouitia sp. 1 TL-2023]
DGNWSSFGLRAGSPFQKFEVLISTKSTFTLLVDPVGCEPSDFTAENCPFYRGGIFDSNKSTTWQYEGSFTLYLEENLGPKFNDSPNFGFEKVSLGSSNTTGGPTLASQVVGTYGINAFYNGLFGLNNQVTNFTSLTDSHPSFISTLLSERLIPSLSWSYTAGAYYRGFFGSLTFGGYDASRFEPNDVSFSFGSDIERDLLVDVRSITSTYSNGSTMNLLPQSVLAFIDSTVSPIYLPQAACDVFAEAFGLTYNSTLKLYLIDDKIHEKMVASNPNITFTLGDQSSGGSTVDIVFPYSSFDLEAVFPRVYDTNWYFPLQPADNDTQYTLGRVFLQEA